MKKYYLYLALALVISIPAIAHSVELSQYPIKLIPNVMDKIPISDSEDSFKVKNIYLSELIDSDTDDQTLDVFTFADDVLSISLSDDGHATKAVYLGTLRSSDDQEITDFSLDDTTITLTIERGNTVTLDIGGSFADTATLSGIQTFAEVNTFTLSPIVPTPTTDYQASTKKYVDDVVISAGGYADENAQDAVGGIISGADGVTATYTDESPSIVIGVGTLNQSTTGNAATATALATPRTIGGVSFNGTANIDLPGVNTTGNQPTSGNAATATKLINARNISGVSFDGTANITIPSSGVSVATTSFNGNLSSLDDTVLKALNTLDDVVAGTGATQLDALTDVSGDGTAGYMLYDDGDGTFSFAAAPSGTMDYPSANNLAWTTTGSSWASMALDIDLSAVSASDDSVPSAKATKALADLKADAADITEVDAYIETFMEGGALNSPYVITGKINVSSFSADHTFTDTEMGGGYVTALATSDYDLPAASTSVGMSVCLGANAALEAVISVTPATANFVVNNGVKGTAATTFASTCDLGDAICLLCVNSTDWVITKLVGTWGE